jgi:hypothetical protein
VENIILSLSPSRSVGRLIILSILLLLLLNFHLTRLLLPLPLPPYGMNERITSPFKRFPIPPIRYLFSK